MIDGYFPEAVNKGPWLTSYTLPTLQRLDSTTTIILPVCSLGTPYGELADRRNLVLPPLFHEALDESLKARILDQITSCFPRFGTSDDSDPQLEIVELARRPFQLGTKPKVLAFSVDTAVEEHGPHLPLATDTIQSYGVLQQLKNEIDGVFLGPPVEYGQLTWGLPFGFSIDLTAELLTEYVCRFTDAVVERISPEGIYVVDVHGSIVHRNAIIAGLEQSRAKKWRFRWLHEPLVEFAAERQDQHAGGVETALVEYINVELVDRDWWPVRIGEISAGQMDFWTAVDLTSDVVKFAEFVGKRELNGVVGRIENYHKVDANLMFDRMLAIAREDVASLL